MSNPNQPPQPEYALTDDYLYEYEGLWQQPATCRIRVYERGQDAPVVIATELPENKGTSITNMAEFLAAEVISRHFPERFESTDAEPVIWIEQYPRPPRALMKLPEFSRVQFRDYTPHVEWLSKRKRIRVGLPTWKYLEREEVEQLVGPVDPVYEKGEE